MVICDLDWSGDNLRFGWHFPVSDFWKDTFHPVGSGGNVDGCPGERLMGDWQFLRDGVGAGSTDDCHGEGTLNQEHYSEKGGTDGSWMAFGACKENLEGVEKEIQILNEV